MIKSSSKKELLEEIKRISIMYGITSQSCTTLEVKSSIRTLEVFREAMATTRLCSPIKSMKLCGRTPIPNDAMKSQIEIYDTTAFISGNATCGSCWCPNCMKRAKITKIERITNGLEGAISDGKEAYLLTLTVPRSSNAIEQIRLLMEGWKHLQNKVRYQLKKKGIKLDFVRSLDITFKVLQDKTFHAHLHIIFVLSKPFSSFESYPRRNLDEIDQLNQSLKKKEKSEVFRYRTLWQDNRPRYRDGKNYKVTVNSIQQLFCLAWHDVMKQKGLTISLQAQHIEKIEKNQGISRYLAKFQGMGLELMNFQNKKGKNNKTPALQKLHGSIGFMELLGHVSKGNDSALQKYQEFILASHGTRVMGFSSGWIELEEVGKSNFEELLLAPGPKETKFYNSEGELILPKSSELLYEREIPENWIHFMNNVEFWIQDRYYIVIDIFPVACFKAFHLGEIDELETLFFNEHPHANPLQSAYLLEKFLLQYWKPKYLPIESINIFPQQVESMVNE